MKQFMTGFSYASLLLCVTILGSQATLLIDPRGDYCARTMIEGRFPPSKGLFRFLGRSGPLGVFCLIRQLILPRRLNQRLILSGKSRDDKYDVCENKRADD